MSTWTPSAVFREERERVVEVEAASARRGSWPSSRPGPTSNSTASAPASTAAASASMRVLGRDGGGATMADHERAALAPADDHSTRSRSTLDQMPNVVWISRQAVREKTTVRKIKIASTTQKRAFELRAAFCRR